jgi:hypothetical protein
MQPLLNLEKQNIFGLILIIIWTLFWKGLALWTAVKANNKDGMLL